MVIYETINKINGNRYIGKDSKNDPEYLGSGTLLKRAFVKHGKENFVKSILDHCETIEELNEKEIHWIEITDAVNSKIYYNIAKGGAGGDCISGLSPEKYAKYVEACSARMMGEKNSFYEKTHTAANKKKMSFPGESNPRHGIKVTEETKSRQSISAKGRYTLQWFIERYGEEGEIKYKVRCKRLSDRKLKGENNPSYRHVDKDELTNLIKTTKMNLHQLCEHFNVGSTAMYGKFKRYYNCKNLKQVKAIL